MTTLKLCIIGIGNMGRAHAVAVANGKVEGLRLTAVCDTDETKTASFCHEYEHVAAFADYHDLLTSGSCDAVLIAVPHKDHAHIAIDALNAGLHALVEKPVDIHKSEEDARATMHVVEKICASKHVELRQYEKDHRIWGETQDFKIFCSYIHPNKTMFQTFLENIHPKNERPQTFANICVSVSMAIEQPRGAQIYHLVQMIVDAGGSYTRVASQCDVFVTLGSKEGRICKRTKTAHEARRGGRRIEFITLDELLKRLNLTKQAYEDLPLPDIHWL
jgi:hypothetical protein